MDRKAYRGSKAIKVIAVSQGQLVLLVLRVRSVLRVRMVQTDLSVRKDQKVLSVRQVARLGQQVRKVRKATPVQQD